MGIFQKRRKKFSALNLVVRKYSVSLLIFTIFLPLTSYSASTANKENPQLSTNNELSGQNKSNTEGIKKANTLTDEQTNIKKMLINDSSSEKTSESVTEKSDDINITRKDDIAIIEEDSSMNISKTSENQTSTKRTCLLPESNYYYSFIPIYIFLCAYSFLAIAITCHYYFLPSLTRVCEELKMSEDVVGATFMAAGSSAPEFATVVIAVFFTKDDIGISDVIGSAVFNMMFVIAMCAFMTTTVVRLNWWPLCRNCFFYVLSVFALLITISNGKVSWFESLILILIYVLYCFALYHNTLLEAWVHTLPLPFNKLMGQPEVLEMENNSLATRDQTTTYDAVTVADSMANGIQSSPTHIQSPDPEPNTAEQDVGTKLEENASIWERIKYYTLFPIHYVNFMTIPNCKKEKWQNCYLLTFIMSMIWISMYSYVLIWMIELLGITLKIPDTVMGLTFMAAGVSVPDAITSIDVVKKGYGDMGVSNAIGSNIFDILMCLGLPWFLKTAIISPGNYVAVHSKGMVYSTLLLFSTAILLVTTAYLNNWKLDKKFGIVLMIGYFVFITFAAVYELVDNQNLYCV